MVNFQEFIIISFINTILLLKKYDINYFIPKNLFKKSKKYSLVDLLTLLKYFSTTLLPSSESAISITLPVLS